MAYSQAELGRRFRNGYTAGSASNVEIRKCEGGGTMLVGYGHAVYAYRSPAGHITAYAGWKVGENLRQWAGTTSTKQQFSKLKLRQADEVVEGAGCTAAPKADDFEAPLLA